jgi:hypothetical protein
VHVACQGYFCLVGGTFINPGGDGWVCEGNETSDLTCTNDTLLAPGESLPPLKAPIAVDPWRTSTVYATWVLSNDSDTNAADDTVDIATPVVDTIRTHLTLSVADSGKPFAPAPNEAPYTVGGEWTAVVRNTGTVASSGTTTVRIGCSGYFCSVGGYFVGAGGTEWACDGDQSERLVCTNATPVPAGGSLAPLVVPVAPWRDNNNVYATFSLENPSDNNTDDNAVEISSPTTSREPAGGDMVVNLRANQPMFNAGGKGTYTITARNAGTAAIEGTISLYASTNYGASQASGDGWTCDAATGECTRPGPVAPGEVLPPVTATTEQFPLIGTPSQVRAGATVTTDNDPNPGNSQGIYLTTTVTPDDADLTATLTDGGAPFTIGGDGHYTITVHNVGTGAANGDISVIYQTAIPQAESVSVNGQGWSCADGTCTRPGPVAAGQVLPPVTATFHFPSSATVMRIDASTSVSVDNDGQNANNQGIRLSTNLVPSAARPSVTYVAMGDSYSAGEGLGPPAGPPYLPGTDISEPYRNQCHRHQGAYSQRLAEMWRLPAPKFVACSGAITADYKNANAENNFHTVGELEHPQKEALSTATKIVTFTFGGNDAGFVKVIETCTYEGFQNVRPDPHCSKAKKYADFRKETDAAIAAVSGKLANVISDVLNTAPDAHVFVADYPIPFGTFYTGKNPPDACKIGRVDLKNVWKGPIPIPYTDLFVDADDASWINHEAAKLNRAIQQAVSTVNSSRVTYVPITGGFSGHRFCDSQASWLNEVAGSYDGATKEQKLWSGSFHPKDAGQKAYAQRFDAAYDKTFGLPTF